MQISEQGGGGEKEEMGSAFSVCASLCHCHRSGILTGLDLVDASM